MKDQIFYIIELDGVLQPMHYDTYNEAYNGIISAFKANADIKSGNIAKCTYKDLNVTINNKKSPYVVGVEDVEWSALADTMKRQSI